ncbi:MAG: coproporphyrinogen-III oxidase family protein, partial [Bacillota bacterium]
MEAYGLYIHIPFCAQKCHYCDFNSIVADKKLKTRYLSALKEEIKLIADKYQPLVRTIYIGGGTPTLLSGAQLNNILKEVTEEFELKSDLEITIEANPGTLTAEKLKAIKEGGVNRLSIGVQSFNNRILKKLGRIHSVEDAVNSYYLA